MQVRKIPGECWMRSRQHRVLPRPAPSAEGMPPSVARWGWIRCHQSAVTSDFASSRNTPNLGLRSELYGGSMVLEVAIDTLAPVAGTRVVPSRVVTAIANEVRTDRYGNPPVAEVGVVVNVDEPI